MPKQKLPSAVKATKVQLRLRPAEKSTIAKAAKLRQTTLSKFMLDHAVQAAQQVLADQIHFTLSPQRWKAFCRALDAPPREIPALRELFERRGIFDGPATSSG